MKARWLGWAGVELESGGSRLLIDVLGDPRESLPAGAQTEFPQTAGPGGPALAALLTHLHRDHCDARALQAALEPEGVVLRPERGSGNAEENLWTAQAEAELEASGLDTTILDPWEQIELGPFTITAVPAVDGLGDPQLSWVVEDGSSRAIHLGDTMFHGYWWRIVRRCGPIDSAFLPINGALLDLPPFQPASRRESALTPDQAAEAARILGVKRAVPIHHGGFDIPPFYVSQADAAASFAAAAEQFDFEAVLPTAGEEVELGSTSAAGDS